MLMCLGAGAEEGAEAPPALRVIGSVGDVAGSVGDVAGSVGDVIGSVGDAAGSVGDAASSMDDATTASLGFPELWSAVDKGPPPSAQADLLRESGFGMISPRLASLVNSSLICCEFRFKSLGEITPVFC